METQGDISGLQANAAGVSGLNFEQLANQMMTSPTFQGLTSAE